MKRKNRMALQDTRPQNRPARNHTEIEAMATFVLVHGSWHGAWCWHKIVPRLRSAGHTVLAPDLPGHGKDWRLHKSVTLQDYVRRIGDTLSLTDERVVLVAHSRGGVVASEAAEAWPDRIAKLVYLAAFLLPSGQRVLEYGQRDADSLVPPNLEVRADEGWDMLRRSAFHPALYHDCADEDVALCEALLTPEPIQPTLTRLQLSEERYGSVARCYIELTQDRAVSPALQRSMRDAMPCERVISLDAGHSAYFSKPDELAAHLASLA
jgi:pimeloyl-ACP methyl ester carboxylesterase